jgi:16S rRNA (cytosine967-C5)-methyltransferase
VQDEGSQLLALLLDAKRGEMVVDFCAGAGGKTLAIGAACATPGGCMRLTLRPPAGRAQAALARSGLSNVHPAAIAHERDDRIKRLAGKIDRVLVDAPCSGLGTLRRNPDLKWRQSPKSVEELVAKQTAILQSARACSSRAGGWCMPPAACCRRKTRPLPRLFHAPPPGFHSR